MSRRHVEASLPTPPVDWGASKKSDFLSVSSAPPTEFGNTRGAGTCGENGVCVE